MLKRYYRDLVVWQRAIELVPLVYRAVKRLPREETYALGDQLRRAAVSIPANIAEGQARQHPKEFVQYLTIARGSLAELSTLLILTQRLDYIDQATLDELDLQLERVAKPLHGLIARLSSHPGTQGRGPTTRNQQQTTPARGRPKS